MNITKQESLDPDMPLYRLRELAKMGLELAELCEAATHPWPENGDDIVDQIAKKSRALREKAREL